jgi:hypothetical protein
MYIRTALLALVVAASACKGGAKGGGGTEYKHPSPAFKVMIPSGLTKRMVHPEGDGGNLAFNNDDGSRDILLVWAKTGSQYDPEGNWSTYGHEADNKKIIAEGKLPGDGGKWLENDRGRIYVHAVASKGGWGVLCMTSSASDKPDRALLDACKTLTID